MTGRRNLLLWFSFASIPLAALVIVLVTALKPGRSEASRQINRIEPGMSTDQVKAAIGNTNVIATYSGYPPYKTYLTWNFPDGSALLVTVWNDRVIDWHEVIQESRP